MSKVADSIRRGLEQAVACAADEANQAPPDTLDPRIRRIAEAIGRHIAREHVRGITPGSKPGLRSVLGKLAPIEEAFPPIEDTPP